MPGRHQSPLELTQAVVIWQFGQDEGLRGILSIAVYLEAPGPRLPRLRQQRRLVYLLEGFPVFDLGGAGENSVHGSQSLDHAQVLGLQ